MAKILSMGPGDVIIQEGGAGNSIYLLQKGKLNVFVRKDGKNRKIGEVEEGELFGEMAFVEKQDRSATIIAASHCEIVEIGRESFDKCLHDVPKWLQKFIKTLMKRLRTKNFDD